MKSLMFLKFVTKFFHEKTHQKFISVHIKIKSLMFVKHTKMMYVMKSNLNNHLQTQPNERSLANENCNKRFLGRRRLNQHSRTHTCEKFLLCKACIKELFSKLSFEYRLPVSYT